ncbi:MAG TPA: arabinogalactan endo-1,4-beta-galactosidase [Marinilabiliaceae bacterium]|nr:arabinogalactan endo-1,4-beta-galactosidase [Marinilabiliaceae bacterium]
MQKWDTLIFAMLLALVSLAASCSDENGKTEPEPPIEEDRKFYFGVDLSYVNQVEDKGGAYKTSEGELSDPFILLAQSGANLSRVRIWHNPAWVLDLYDEPKRLYSAYDDVEKTIRRSKHAGMDVLLDFHYSDTWADPGKQEIPSAWRNITNIDVLADSVYNYTYKILQQLDSKNLLPQMVQIGNETNCGMMISNKATGFPDLNICNGNWTNFGVVVNAGIKAIRDIEDLTQKEIKAVLHVADPKNIDYWTRDIIAKGKVTDFDIMGLSYYHIWHTTVGFADLPNKIADVKNKYGKDIMILETAYPFTVANNDGYNNIYYNQQELSGFPYSIEGQKDFLITLNQNMIDAGALGVIYWEPAWISSQLNDLWGKGSSWENCAFFDFNGNASSALEYLKHPYTFSEK